jgi:hypothetical protein
MSTAIPALLLASALGIGGADTDRRPATVRVCDLATLTPAQASRLTGKRAIFRITLDSLPGEWDGFTEYDCKSPDAVERTICLYRSQDVEDEMVVEATLQLLRHDPAPGFAGFVEYRLVRAVVRRRP